MNIPFMLPRKNTVYPLQLRILLIDHHENTRLQMMRQFKDKGHTTILFDSSISALRSLQDDLPDIVVCSLNQPHLDGIGLVERIRNDRRLQHLPCILTTHNNISQSHEISVHKAFKAGVDDIVSYDLDFDVVMARIEHARKTRSVQQSSQQVIHIARERIEIQHDLEEASIIQHALLPEFPCHLSHWTITGTLIPWRGLSGDAYDFVQHSEMSFTTFLLDVSGHGISTALLASTLSKELRLLLKQHALEKALDLFNQHLLSLHIDRYVCLGILQTEGDHITLVNAGLPPIARLRPEKEPILYESSGTPLGIFPEIKHIYESIKIEAGELMVMLSDGLTEPFGAADESLRILIRGGISPYRGVARYTRDKLRSVIETVFEQRNQLRNDDISLVVLEYQPTSARIV
jgi:sigma-B regulation protein RsbU (phosphoserine phosphatase)